MSRPGETIAATRPAPASRAARIGQATIGRPQTGCSIFGVEERIRVPWPAAMTRTRGAATARQVIGEGGRRRLGAPRNFTAPRETSLPTEATEISVQPAKIRSMPTSRPIAQSALEGNLARTRIPMIRPQTPLSPTQPAFGWPRPRKATMIRVSPISRK